MYVSCFGLQDLSAHHQIFDQASNAYLDGLSLWRAASDLPFCSVQWGPVAEVGMASKAGRFQLPIVTHFALGLGLFSGSLT